MGKKRDKANENIIMLIDEIIELKKSLYQSQCLWDDCRHEGCEQCKERRYEELRDRMEKKYIVE